MPNARAAGNRHVDLPYRLLPRRAGWLAGKYRRGRSRRRPERVEIADDRGWSESWSRYANEHTWSVVDAVAAIADEAGRSPAQVALNWLLRRPGVTTQEIIGRSFKTMEYYALAGALYLAINFSIGAAGRGSSAVSGRAEQPMDAVLSIRGLTKSFGAGTILRNVDLDVFPGVVSIIGATGSGKTTLLRCIDLFEEFDEGEVRLDGDELGYRSGRGGRQRLSGRDLARIGMVFQSYNLFPHLNAIANVTPGLTKVRRLPKARAREIAEAWHDRVGLADRREHFPSALSGGQQQRVAIARALAMEPRLLLDEVACPGGASHHSAAR